jgi:hypothetical protein
MTPRCVAGGETLRDSTVEDDMCGGAGGVSNDCSSQRPRFESSRAEVQARDVRPPPMRINPFDGDVNEIKPKVPKTPPPPTAQNPTAPGFPELPEIAAKLKSLFTSAVAKMKSAVPNVG